jgi:hypothetical protein
VPLPRHDMTLSPFATDAPEDGNPQELSTDVSKLSRGVTERQRNAPIELSSLRCIEKLNIDPFVLSKVVHVPEICSGRELRAFIWLPRLPLPICLPGCERLPLFTSAYNHRWR